MRHRIELAFEELGHLNLKNITHPIEAFVLRLGAAADVTKASRTAEPHHTSRQPEQSKADPEPDNRKEVGAAIASSGSRRA